MVVITTLILFASVSSGAMNSDNEIELSVFESSPYASGSKTKPSDDLAINYFFSSNVDAHTLYLEDQKNVFYELYWDEKSNFDVYKKNKDGFTVLHLAVKEGRRDWVEMLLSIKVNIHICDDIKKLTPMEWALISGDKDLFKLFKDHLRVIHSKEVLVRIGNNLFM